MSLKRFFPQEFFAGRTARLGIAFGFYSTGIAQVIDVIALIGALGAIGSLPAILGTLSRLTRSATRSLQGRFSIALLLSLGLLALQGCAQTAIRESSSQGAAPNAIRTLGPDQRFLTLDSLSVARRVRAKDPRPHGPLARLAPWRHARWMEARGRGPRPDREPLQPVPAA